MRPGILLVLLVLELPLNASDIGCAIDVTELAVDTIVSLGGRWCFAWKEFVPPGPVDSIPAAQTLMVTVPEQWNKYRIGGQLLEPDGYASYWVDLLLPETAVGKSLALYVPEIPTAYSLWVDTDLVASVGAIGTDTGSSRPQTKPVIALFIPNRSRVRLLLHVSNFHDYNGGLWKNIRVGYPEKMMARKIQGLAYDLVFFGGLFTIGLYHFILFILRKKDPSIVFFSISCAFLSFRSLVTGEFFLMTLFPDFPWLWYIRLNFFLIYGAVLSFSLFIAYSYRLYFNKIVRYLFIGVSAIFSIALFIRFEKIFLYSWEVYQFFLIAIFLYICFIIVRAIANRIDGAAINILAFAISFVCIVNDILYGKAIIQTMNLSSVGLFAFTISQSAVLAIRYSRTFQRMENISRKLKLASYALQKKNKLINRTNEELQDLYSELDTSQKEIIYRLSEIAETRSKETGNHVKRVSAYVRVLAIEYGFPGDEAQLLADAAPMHDVGKMAIPDEILNKEGKLTNNEFEIMKQHTSIGYTILRNSGRQLLNAAATIALQHHERYDGSGYPARTGGGSIHIYGRIVAVADVFDALASDRCYKRAWPMEDIIEYFRNERGVHFDPRLTDIFLSNIVTFGKILAENKDVF